VLEQWRALRIRWTAALKARPTLVRLTTGIGVVVAAILAVILQLLFWGWIARHTIAVDLPELQVESADRYYSAAEQRYYELVFTSSVPVVIERTDAPTTPIQPLPQVSVTSNKDTAQTCPPNTSSPNLARLSYTCPLSPGQSTIVVTGQRGSRGSAYVWYLDDGRLAGTDVLSRAVHLTLRPRLAQVEYTAWISPQAAVFDALRRKDIPPGLFVKLVFYPGREGFTGGEFYSISEALTTIEENTATVTISGTLSGRWYIAKNVLDVLHLSPPVTGTQHPTHTLLVVQAEGVAVTEFDPCPSQMTGTLLTWQNPLTMPSIVYEESGRPQTIAEPVPRLQKGIADLRSKVGAFFGVLFMLLIPIIPAIWLYRLARRGRYPAAFGWDRAKYTLALSGLLWVVPAASMVLALFSQLGASSAAKTALGHLALWASSVAVAWLALLAYWRLTFVKGTGAGRPMWLQGVIAGLVLYWLIMVLALNSNYLFRRDAILILMGMTPLLAAFALAWLPGRTETSLRGVLRSLGPVTWVLVIVTIVVLAYPSSAMQPLFYPLNGWSVAVWRDFLLPFAVYLLPYVPLIIILAQMHAHKADREPSGAQLAQGIGHLLFAFYLVGATRGLEMGGLARDMGSSAPSIEFNVVPVAFVLAWLVAYRWLIPTGGQNTSMTDQADAIHANRDELIKYVLDVEWAEKARNKRFDESTDSQEYEAAKQQFEEYLIKRCPACLSKGQSPQEVLFAFGPRSCDWENAMLGVRRGLVLMVPLFVIYSPPLLAQAIRSVETVYLPLQLITRYFVPIFLKWIFYAFFLGYFFRHIRGQNGWQKGLSLAVAILFCTLVHDVLVRVNTSQDLLALALDAAQTVLFLTILGLWAFDYQTLRDHGYGWRGLLIVHNVAFLGSYVSSVLVALGTVITTTITGQLTSVVITLLNLVVPGVEAP